MLPNYGKMMRAAIGGGAICSLLLPAAATAFEGPGATGAGYLTRSIGPKSIAMGEVKAALRGDPFNWISNPALLGDMSATGAGMVHTQWILDTQYEHLSLNQRLGGFAAVGGAFFFEHRPDIQGYDDAGLETEKLKNNNYQAVIGFAVSPVPSFSAGVNVKYFQEKLDAWRADGMAFDLGALYGIPVVGVTLGVAVQNLGADVRFDEVEEPLPTTIRAGASHSFGVIPKTLAATYAIDVVKPRYETTYVCVGGEVALYETLAIRAGYCGQESRVGSGFTMGGGVRILDRVQLDYAWTPYGELGNFHRVSLYFSLR
jgi:hypothetical protein